MIGAARLLGGPSSGFGMRVNQAKSLFFDRDLVIRKTNIAERKVLSKFGAFVRRTARSSIRKRKRPSSPGMPPSGHGQELLKRFIFFVYEPARHSVIIGPARLNKIGNAPEALEYGGASVVMLPRIGQPLEKRSVMIGARPYMRPAFEKEKATMPPHWENSIRP